MDIQRPPVFEEAEVTESFLQRWKRKAINNPFLTGGIIGLVGMCGAGTYRYKSLRASGMSTSLFLIQLRVAAQGMVAGALAVALLKDTVVELLNGNKPDSGES